jgi:membrane-bound lytic murein transglycosylase D
MKRLFVAVFIALGIQGAVAQEYEFDLGKAVDLANDWALANLDPAVLKSLGEVDRERVEKFLNGYFQSLQGSNVLELARLRAAATNIIPILAAYEETAPYAAWLRCRLDYFEVSDELRRNLPKPPPRAEVPAATVVTIERKVWVKKLADRPLPPGADKLVPQLKPVFTAEKVPPELVWIAEVESAFDPDACSPVGAVGLFQLMPPTARQYGLRRWPFDQRYQPVPSARAAAKYLRALYRQFGDWPLTLAAYNSGEGRVQSLLKKHKARSFEQIAAKLPAETQMYVPKVEAALLRREKIKLSELPPPGK